MSWQAGLYILAVFLPLAAFLIQFLGVKLLGRRNAYVATGAIGLAFVLSLIGFVDYFLIEAEGVFAHHGASHATATEAHADASHEGEHAPAATEAHHGPVAWTASMNWVTLGEGVGVAGPFTPGLTIPLEIYIDNLGVIMFLMVTFIATLIHLYSMGYMSDDPRYPRFFTFLSLFCFSMLGLVASANLFMVFMCWELVGVCSYLLIGFWYEDKKNCDA
ncbi:MAG: proton-conducting transporter membrane subunit, partial [Isosphaeraceae bacterium]